MLDLGYLNSFQRSFAGDSDLDWPRLWRCCDFPGGLLMVWTAMIGLVGCLSVALQVTRLHCLFSGSWQEQESLLESSSVGIVGAVWVKVWVNNFT